MNVQSGKTLFSAVLAVSILASFAGGFYAGKTERGEVPLEGVKNIDVGQPADVDFSLFWDAWRLIQVKYVNSPDLDFQAMVQGATEGMVESLGDPHTVFLTPGDTRRFLEDVAGTFEGVGMEIGIREEELRVIAPLEGTPAQRAGLRAGDRIVKIDDTFTRDITLDEAVTLIRGPKGAIVTLQILRDDWEEPREFPIERDVVDIPSLQWELRDDSIVYIELFHFSERASGDFRDAARQIANSGAERIVLDVRNNPGGFLETSVDIAGWFLKRGETVVVEDFGDDEKNREYKAKGEARFATYPLVVLINEGSASASEILAGALRDNRGILLIGQKSFGKGSVQELEMLDDDSSLKITVANWLTPKGTLITGEGLEPDILIEMTEEDYEQERDPQLDKAIEVVKNL